MVLDTQNLSNIKSELSFSEVMNNDQSNIANHYNTHRFRQVLEGNIDSPALTYLFNMGHMGISDYKTLDYFNQKMIAVKEMSVGELSEINDSRTIKLNSKYRSKKFRILDIINHRKSTREYVSMNLSFNYFSQILEGLCDMHRNQAYSDITVPTRGYASGGGLYPITLYFLVLNVENLKPGWYKLQPHTHSVLLLSELDDSKDIDIVSGENIEVKKASFLVFYGYDLTKSYPKYGESSLQLGLIEVGEISQLIDMFVTSLSLGSCQSAGFNKNLVQKLLQLDGVTEQILHSQIIGEKND